MNGKIGWITLLLIITSICVVFPATAVLNRVPIGGTVYIGEERLDLSLNAALVAGTQIGWWSPGSAFSTQGPDERVTVTDPLNFAISSMEFGQRTGSWYVLPAKTLAFNVKDPQIGIRIEDTSINGDITDNEWVYRGDEVRFRIDSNLAEIAGRPGAGAAEPTVTIKVQGPDGGTYSALVNKAGVMTLLDVSVTTTPFYTGTVWDTGSSSYTPGTYTIWAECNANRMKDNYNIVGKTVSAQRPLRVQEQNPLIGVTVLTTSPTIQQTLKVTTKPTTIVTTKPATTVLTTMATPVETVQSPTSTTPVPTPTKAAGLSGWCAVLAGIIGCSLYGARRR